MPHLAIDIGGSGSRAALIGDVTVRVQGSPLRREDGRALIEESLEHLAHALPSTHGELDVVAIGAAGLMTMSDPASVAAAAARLWAPLHVVIASDIVTGHLAAWKGAGGVVIAAGTGVTALGTDLSGVWAKADGWGHLLGDSGGGAWIGARGLAAALRRHDRLPGGSELLLDAVIDRWGSVDRLPSVVAIDSAPAAVLASFVPSVVSAADRGDGVAQGILVAAGRELAETAAAVLVDGVPKRVALTGGITRTGEHLARAFRDGLAAHGGDISIRIGESEALDGAIWLALATSDRTAPLDHASFIRTFDLTDLPPHIVPTQPFQRGES